VKRNGQTKSQSAREWPPWHPSKDFTLGWLVGEFCLFVCFLLCSSGLEGEDEGTGICCVSQRPMLRSYVSRPLSFVRLNVAETTGAAATFSVKAVAFRKKKR